MQPRTKFQRKACEVARTLPPITDKQIEYAKQRGTVHVGIRTAKGRITMWLDYIEMIHRQGRDIHNAHYACPTDLHAAHQRAVRKSKVIENEEARRAYRDRMRKFAGLEIEDGNVRVRPLLTVAAVRAEGDAMDHCVYANKYYAREDALLLTAEVAGARTETVEFSLRFCQVVQSRGRRNTNTEHHTRIVELVNANAAVIKKYAQG